MIVVMAITTGAVGAVFGVPIGLVGASVLWRTVADGLHVATDLKLPLPTIVLAAGAAVSMSGLPAVLPAVLGARTKPGAALRADPRRAPRPEERPGGDHSGEGRNMPRRGSSV